MYQRQKGGVSNVFVIFASFVFVWPRLRLEEAYALHTRGSIRTLLHV